MDFSNYDIPYFSLEPLKTFVIEIQIKIINTGWGSGYVLIPPNHKAYGLSMDDLNTIIDVHGGITFHQPVKSLTNDRWWFHFDRNKYINHYLLGFDTAHYGDNLENWSKEHVIEETKKLVKQLNNIR